MSLKFSCFNEWHELYCFELLLLLLLQVRYAPKAPPRRAPKPAAPKTYDLFIFLNVGLAAKCC